VGGGAGGAVAGGAGAGHAVGGWLRGGATALCWARQWQPGR
jgi:hypothetical protein